MKTLFSWFITHWKNQSIQIKLAALLLISTSFSILAVTYAVLEISERQLLNRLQVDLQRQSDSLRQQLDEIASDHELKATALSQQIIALKINPNATSPDQDQMRKILAKTIKTRFEPNFFLITDATGRVVAMRSQVLADWEKMLFLQPSHSNTYEGFRPIEGTPGIDLKQVVIVRDAIEAEQTYTSAQLVPQSILTALGLESQASLPIRWQPTENLPESKRPLPIGEIDHSQGMVIMAVVPIRSNNSLVGTAIVGTLVNRNYTLVDSFQHKSQLSAVTLFAQDLQAATTVPYATGKTRALATLVAREVSNVVLQQGKPFIGETIIVSQPHMAVYQPIYDHRRSYNPSNSKPIGMYLVAESSAKIQQILDQIAWVGYSIGGSILGIMAIAIVPISRRFAAPIQRLTQLAKLMGQGEQSVQFNLDDRRDEVGILAGELNRMTQRLNEQLALVQTSEAQLGVTLQELKQTQTQLIQSEKMSSLGQLVAGIAHEINNPVSFIYGNIHHAEKYVEDIVQVLNLYQSGAPADEIAQVAQDWDLEFAIEDLSKTLSSMRIGANRIHEIVLSLRTFSRLDEAAYKSVNLHDGLESTLLILAHRLKSQSQRPEIAIIKQYDEQLPRVTCYAGQINQVFMNLLANAIEALEEHWIAHPEFQPRITITTTIKEKDQVKVSIADNGTGIPESVQQRLFDPFFTTKPVGKGTGLGLSISYQIITQGHHGSIECFSVPHMGTEFVITLPVQLPA